MFNSKFNNAKPFISASNCIQVYYVDLSAHCLILFSHC